MKSIKYSAIGTMLLVLALLAVACGGGAASPAPTNAPSGGAASPAATSPSGGATKPPAATNVPGGAATTAPSAGGNVTGTITLWHGYHASGSEETAINTLVTNAKKQFPNATINVLEVPFDQLFNKFETEAAAGGGPDMFTAPNDSLGKEVRAGLLAPLDDMVKGKLDSYSKLAIDALTVDGKLYAVPQIPKAVGLYYNKTTVTTPPATTDELMALVKSGKKVGIANSAYHTFGFWRSFGGQLMDNSGKCVADTTGVADALQYLLDLKKAGANFTDDGKLTSLFQQGQLDVYQNGPWVLGDNEKGLGADKVGVAPLPKGPKGNAGPLTGLDGFYVNANSKNKDGAVNLALFLSNKEAQTLYADVAGDPPARTDVTPKDPLVKAFADLANSGFPRPQAKELDNFWGPFGDAVTKVLEGKSDAPTAVKEACAAMNKANSK